MFVAIRSLAGKRAIISQTFGGPSTGLALPLTVAAFDDDLLFTSWTANHRSSLGPNSEAVESVYTDFAVPTNAIILQLLDVR